MILHKRLFTGLILVTCFLQSTAQLSIGTEAGLTYNNVDANIANRTFTMIRPEEGYILGLRFSERIIHCLSITILPGFEQKNWSIRRTGNFEEVHINYRNTYFQLPVLLQRCWESKTKKFLYSVGVGSYYGSWLTGREKGKIPDVFGVSSYPGQTGNTFKLVYYEGPHHFDPHSDRRTEWGWVMEAGIHYRLNVVKELHIVMRYCQALTSFQKGSPSYDNTQYNRVIELGCGYSLVFNRK